MATYQPFNQPSKQASRQASGQASGQACKRATNPTNHLSTPSPPEKQIRTNSNTQTLLTVSPAIPCLQLRQTWTVLCSRMTWPCPGHHTWQLGPGGTCYLRSTCHTVNHLLSPSGTNMYTGCKCHTAAPYATQNMISVPHCL